MPYYWHSVCIQDIRKEVLLRLTPSDEGTTRLDGPYSGPEEAARFGRPAETSRRYESHLIWVDPEPTTEPGSPKRRRRQPAKAIDADDRAFLEALGTV